MRKAFCGLVVITLLAGQPLFSEEGNTAVQTAEQKEIVALKVDLLASQKATLEARSEALRLQNELLRLEIAIWHDARDKTRQDLSRLLGCEYDLDKRACKPKVGALPP